MSEITYSVVINKATRDPFVVASGLAYQPAVDLAGLWYRNWSLLYQAKVADPVVRLIVVVDGDHETFTESSIVFRFGAV